MQIFARAAVYYFDMVKLHLPSEKIIPNRDGV